MRRALGILAYSLGMLLLGAMLGMLYMMEHGCS